MSTFVAIAYDDPHKALEVRLALVKLQKEYLIELEDAVVAVKDEAGKIKFHQAVNLTGAGAIERWILGDVNWTVVPEPTLRLAVGGSAGAVSGALSDIGINDKFMKILGRGDETQ